jgi:hypothetical protein
MDGELTKAQVLATLQVERRAWDALLAEVGDARMGPGAAGESMVAQGYPGARSLV